MNSQKLIRWAGLSALVAGLCFVALGLSPSDSLSSVTTSRWAIIHSLAIAMSVFGLLGMTGLYGRQAEAAGWLGLAGYLLWSLWLVLVLPFNFFEAFILPLLATEAPGFAENFLRVVTRSAGEMNFGVLADLWALSDILFLVGGLIFGIGTLRAGILSRRAAGVLPSGSGWPPCLRCSRTSWSRWWRCRSAWVWPGWAGGCGLNGMSTPRTPSLAGGSLSCAKPQPSKLAESRTAWTDGHTVACLILASHWDLDRHAVHHDQ